VLGSQADDDFLAAPGHFWMRLLEGRQYFLKPPSPALAKAAAAAI
jgi:hypothetical protein